MKYDLIIIGMGIAGISAAIYAKNGGLNILLLEKDVPGGLVNKIGKITNYPGHAEISGPDLSFHLFESINKLKIPYKKATVKQIKNEKNKKIIETDIGNFETKYILITTGRGNRKLGIKKEEELFGKGISTCALCDGNLYQGKDIAVVGGGNSALEEALYLSNIVNKVYLIHRNSNFRAEENRIEKVKEKENIEIITDANITSLEEKEGKLVGIILDNQKEIPVEALFEYIGFIPHNDFVKDLGILDEEGYIEVDQNYETKVKGIYAGGDCIKKKVYQLITGANDGVIATIQIMKQMENK